MTHKWLTIFSVAFLCPWASAEFGAGEGGTQETTVQAPAVLGSSAKDKNVLIGQTDSANRTFDLKRNGRVIGQVQLIVKNNEEPYTAPISVEIKIKCAGQQDSQTILKTHVARFNRLEYDARKNELIPLYSETIGSELPHTWPALPLTSGPIIAYSITCK